jgi:hypothetical protein
MTGADMPTLEAFESALSQIIGRPSARRPFVCEGSPLACTVFLCGFNPASPSTTDFWAHWRPSYGFEKEKWFVAYQAERLARPLKSGRIRRNAISNSRRVIDWVVAGAAPVKCLETNIHSVPSESMADFDSPTDSTAAFTFLLSTIRPRLVVTHGEAADEFMRRIQSGVRTIAVKHFSRGWSQARAQALGREIASLARSDS